MPNLADMDRCTGCTACVAVCPKSCIRMMPDEEGFLQPVVSGDCVDCGACERVCPILRKSDGFCPSNQIAVAAVALDNSLWKSSSSGGAFTCVCRAFASLDPGTETVVYGATMAFPHVMHVRCNLSEMSLLRKSKYVQSDKKTTFRQVRDDLRAGRRVIFSGTPCEVAGLSSYLGTLSNAETLLLVDLICHGAGSPAVFDACMDMASAELGTVVDYEFRSKHSHMGNYERHTSKITFMDNNRVIRHKYVSTDSYNKLFLNQACLRRSCMEHCQFRTRSRFGDITLADLNGKSYLFPEYDDGRAWSTVVGNSDKGRSVISTLSNLMDIHPSSPDDVAMYNPLFDHSTPGNPRRNDFFRRFIAGDRIEVLVKEFGLSISCRDRVMSYIPRNFKTMVKNLKRAVLSK